MPKILQISDLILKIMIWMICILASSVTLFPALSLRFPWAAASWPLYDAWNIPHISPRRAFVLAVPRKSEGFFILFRSAQMPPTHEGFLDHFVYSSFQNCLPFHPAFFFRTLASKVILYFKKFPSVSVLSLVGQCTRGPANLWHGLSQQLLE